MWLMYLLRNARHFISAKNTHGFGIHSPFLYQFTRYVIDDKTPFYFYHQIEKCRQMLLADTHLIFVDDLGTGASRSRQVRSIARTSLKSPAYGQLLSRMVYRLKPQCVLELGTSLGISTCYMAAPNSHMQCITLEGSAEIASIAQQTFRAAKCANIKLVQGNIDDTLPLVLAGISKLDMVFLDANHTQTATIKYFEACVPKMHAHSVAVVDDINWSTGMRAAWQHIKSHAAVTATIELPAMGIVFFDKHFQKKCYKMRF